MIKCSDIDGGVAPGDDHEAVELPRPAPDVVRGPGPGQQWIIERVPREQGTGVRGAQLVEVVWARMPVIGKVVAPETVVIVLREPHSSEMAMAENTVFVKS